MPLSSQGDSVGLAPAAALEGEDDGLGEGLKVPAGSPMSTTEPAAKDSSKRGCHPSRPVDGWLGRGTIGVAKFSGEDGDMAPPWDHRARYGGAHGAPPAPDN